MKHIFVFLTFYTHLLFAQDFLDEQLYLSIDSCNLMEIEEVLKNGANANALLTKDIVNLLKHQLNFDEAHTPLSYAISKTYHCFEGLKAFLNGKKHSSMDCLKQVPLDQKRSFEENYKLIQEHIKKIIHLLMSYNASPETLISPQYHWYADFKVPVLHYPFLFNNKLAHSSGADFFLFMVQNGAEASILDSEGRNALRYLSFFHKEKDITDLMETNLSFMQKGNESHTSTDLFPPLFQGSIQNWQSREDNFDYKTGDFSWYEFAHPIVRNFLLLSSPQSIIHEIFPTLDEKSKKEIVLSYMKVSQDEPFDSFRIGIQASENLNSLSTPILKFETYLAELLPYMRDLINIPSGKDKIPPIAHLMILSCPTIEKKNSRYYSFSNEESKRFIFDNQYNNMQRYQLLRDLVKNEDFDVNLKDQHGNTIMDYAIHLCPFEVVEDLYNRFPNDFKDNYASKDTENDIDTLRKYYGQFKLFNNDERTISFLKENGLFDEEKFSFAMAQKKNRLLPWKTLTAVGLDREYGTNFTLITKYQFEKYVDYTEELFPLNEQDSKSVLPRLGEEVVFNFKTPPIAIHLTTYPESSPSDKVPTKYIDPSKGCRIHPVVIPARQVAVYDDPTAGPVIEVEPREKTKVGPLQTTQETPNPNTDKTYWVFPPFPSRFEREPQGTGFLPILSNIRKLKIFFLKTPPYGRHAYFEGESNYTVAIPGPDVGLGMTGYESQFIFYPAICVHTKWSERTEPLTKNFSSTIHLNRNHFPEQEVSHREEFLKLLDDRSMKYSSLTPAFQTDNAFIDSIIRIRKDDKGIYVSIDEDLFAKEDPILYQVWNYIHAYSDERIKMIHHYQEGISQELLAYLLELLPGSLEMRERREESVGIFNIIFRHLYTGTLPFDHETFFEKFKNFPIVDPDEIFFNSIHSYLILRATNDTGAFKMIFQDITSSKAFLIEFISWARSLKFVYPYSRKIRKIISEIESKKEGITKGLNLTDKEQEFIFTQTKVH